MKQKKENFKTIVSKIANRTLDNMKEEVAYEIEKHYESVVQAFYDDYMPSFYRRTYSTFLASDGYNNTYRTIRPFKDGYRIGIHVSSDHIPGNPYVNLNPEDNLKKKEEKQEVKDWVFRNTFLLGYHGWEGRYHPMTPTPERRMSAWFDGLKNNQSHALDKIKNKALDKAVRSI